MRTCLQCWKWSSVQVAEGIDPFHDPLRPLDTAAVLGQEFYQRINVNPNFAAAFLLTFVKNQLHAEMQVVNFNVIGVFLIGIPRPSHESDDIPGIYRLPHRQVGGKGLVLQQVRVVIVALAVMTADAHTPSAIAVPTQCFHRAAMIDLLASSGMRVGELVTLNREDINFNERECVVIGKGNKERLVYFDARTKIHLQNYLEGRTDENPALFVSLKAPFDRLMIGGVETRLRELGKRLNIPKVHPHKFRRTLATTAIDKGMPIEQVQQLLGHQKIDTTMHYAIRMVEL